MQRPPKLLRKALAKMARGNPAPRELFAFHEAAHVVMAWILGVKVSRVSLDDDEAARTRSDLAAITSRECGTWAENARISVAGLVADEEIEEHEMRLEYDLSATGEHNDVASMKQCLYYAAGLDVEGAKQLIEPTFQFVMANLARNRRQWLELAERLCRRRSMESTDIARILGPLPDVDEETHAARAAATQEIKAGCPALSAEPPEP